MKRYREIKIFRENSDYPTGLKHYKRDTTIENSLFDIELIKYKVMGLLKGHENDKERRERNKANRLKSAKEILRGYVFGILYESWHSATDNREDRGIEELYLKLGEADREAGEKSNQGSYERVQESTQE